MGEETPAGCLATFLRVNYYLGVQLELSSWAEHGITIVTSAISWDTHPTVMALLLHLLPLRLFVVLISSASSGCTCARLYLTTSPALDAVGTGEVRMLWATPGPELHIASSGCCGPRLDLNSISMWATPGPEHMPKRMPDTMPERLPDRMSEFMTDAR